MAKEKKVLITKQEHHDFLEQKDELKELKKEMKSYEKENYKLKKVNDALIKEKEALIDSKAALKTKLRQVIDELMAERAGGRKKKSTKHLQKQDVNEAIHNQVRDITSRNVKFAQAGTELTTVTSKIWTEIKDAQKLEQGDQPLDLKKFVHIYGSVVQSELSVARQYVQTRCQSAARGMNNIA
jgi:chromosome segregation ATPase